MRMSFRVNFTDITGAPGNDPKTGERLRGHGSASAVVSDLAQYRDEAGVKAFQINFNGCPALGALEDSMARFMAEVAPVLA